MLSRFIKHLARAPQPAGAVAEDGAFLEDLTRTYARCAQQVLDDNFDHDRYGEEAGARLSGRTVAFATATLGSLMSEPGQLARAYGRFSDALSRRWFVDLVVYRLLGHRHVRLARNDARFRADCERARGMGEDGAALSGGYGPARRYRMAGTDGESVVLDGWWFNIAWPFLIGQYRLDRDQVRIAVEPGDRVIDAGACFGDTTLAFADAAGSGGRVHAFEIIPGNLAVARHNLSLNPRFASSVHFSAEALGERCGTLYVHGGGTGAMVSTAPSAEPVAVTTIDDYVRREALERIDFIKMDIEGSETAALRGATDTLRRFRPKLAISLYHRPVDLWQIPLWVDSLGLGYRLYLDHYTIHLEETVLYAVAH